MGFKETYFETWTTAWNLHKKFYGIKADDETQWKELDAACEQITKKYDGEPAKKFVENLLLSVVGELERSARHGETTGTASKA